MHFFLTSEKSHEYAATWIGEDRRKQVRIYAIASLPVEVLKNIIQ